MFLNPVETFTGPYKSEIRELNPGHTAYKAAALPAELISVKSFRPESNRQPTDYKSVALPIALRKQSSGEGTRTLTFPAYEAGNLTIGRPRVNIYHPQATPTGYDPATSG